MNGLDPSPQPLINGRRKQSQLHARSQSKSSNWTQDNSIVLITGVVFIICVLASLLIVLYIKRKLRQRYLQDPERALMAKTICLDDALIPSAPSSTYYIPDFLTLAEADQLLQKVESVPLPTWRHLSHRRLQAHPSPLTPSNTLLAASLPPWLQNPVIPQLLQIPITKDTPGSIKNIFSDSPHQAPNHCLINEYTPGQGIPPHEDGAAYHPVVATVSLGAPIVLDVYRKPAAGESLDAKPAYRILQEPGSLLISTGEMYTKHLHGIVEVEVDKDLHGGQGGVVNWEMLGSEWKERFEEERGEWKRETRVSLTFRDVLKVKSLGKGLGFMSKGKK
ncbi:MAG: hypothetical protein Q9166_004575 [cf. Caloplaca sp. 2 TL-2023]